MHHGFCIVYFQRFCQITPKSRLPRFRRVLHVCFDFTSTKTPKNLQPGVQNAKRSHHPHRVLRCRRIGWRGCSQRCVFQEEGDPYEHYLS